MGLAMLEGTIEPANPLVVNLITIKDCDCRVTNDFVSDICDMFFHVRWSRDLCLNGLEAW